MTNNQHNRLSSMLSLAKRPLRGEIWIMPEVLQGCGLTNDINGLIQLSSSLGADFCFSGFSGPQPVKCNIKSAKETAAKVKEANLACGAVIDGPWQRLTWKNDMMTLLMEIAADQEMISSKLKVMADRASEELAIWIEAGIDMILLTDDVAYNGGPYFSPQHFQELLLPIYNRFFEQHFNEKATPIGFHSDGNPELLLSSLIDAGFSFYSLETEAADLNKIWQRHGEDKIIMAGLRAAWLNGVNNMSDQPDYRVELPDLMGRGCLILSSACGLYHPQSVEKLKEIYQFIDHLEQKYTCSS